MGKCASTPKNTRRSLTSMSGSSPGIGPRKRTSMAFERQPTLRPSIKTKVRAEAVTASVSVEPQTPRTVSSLLEILKGHFLFTMMSDGIIKHLIKKMKTYTLEADEIVYKQGDIGINFFIVIKGRLDVRIDDESTSILNPNNCFGELGLIQDKERNSTVITLEKVKLKGIDRSSYREALSSINEKRHEENLTFIESVPILKKLTKYQLQQLLGVIVLQKFSPGQTIINEEETGDLFYIIKEGTVHCTRKGVLLRDFTVGESFGEQALLYQSKRKATIIAAGKVVLISIDRANLIRALGHNLDKIVYQNTIRIAFTKSDFLKNLSPVQVDTLIDKMEMKKYSSGDKIALEGIPRGNELFVIVNGELSCGESKYRVYDMIGDEELRVEDTKKNFRYNLIAEEESDVASIKKIDFEKSIGGAVKTVLGKNQLIEVLKNVNLFRILPLAKLQQMINVLKNQDFGQGENIFQQGSPGDKFFIVKEGSVEIIKDGVSIRKIEANGFFGERSIILEELRTATARAVVPTKCWTIDSINFKTLIDIKIHQELIKRIELQNDNISLNDLQYIKILPEPIFGKSFLCRHQSSKIFYSLKAINRKSIGLYNIYNKISTERRIMKAIDHPFIAKMIRTFKDDDRVYFLFEHVKGLDLFDVIREIDINNDSARFYAGGIVLILEYLHTHNIIYRDLKPENVMIDEDGYPKIIDFGNAKILENRTYSTVGTPHYMAPEVISGKGYSFSADYWSLGIMIYEFLFNKLPFCSDETDCYIIYQSILLNPLIYPQGNYLAKPLLDQLLLKNPALRGTYRTIKEHSWFIGQNWDALLAKEIKAHFIPNIDNYEQEVASLIKSKSKIDLFTMIAVNFI